MVVTREIDWEMRYMCRVLNLNRYNKSGKTRDRAYYNRILTKDIIEVLDERIKSLGGIGFNVDLELYYKHKIEDGLTKGEDIDVLKCTNNISERRERDSNLIGIMWEYFENLPILAKHEYCSIRMVVEGREDILLVTYLDFWEFVTVENGKFIAGPYDEVYDLRDFYTPPHGRELMTEVNRLYDLYERRAATTKDYEALEEIVVLVKGFIEKEKTRNKVEMNRLIDNLTSK